MVRKVIKGVVIGLMLLVVVSCLTAMIKELGPAGTGITLMGMAIILGIIWVVIKLLTKLTE